MNGIATAQVSGVVVWVALLFLGLFVVPRTAYVSWRLWRHGERPKSYNKGYSNAQMTDYARMGPTTVVCLTALVIGVGVDHFAGTGDVFLKLVVLISGLLFFIAGLLSFSVRYLRRPQWCIAPVLREPGRPRPRRG